MCEASKKLWRMTPLKRLVVLAFCSIMPFSSFAQTSNQLNAVLTQETGLAKVKPPIFVNRNRSARKNSDQIVSLETVEFPDRKIDPVRFGAVNEASPNIAIVPDETRTYKLEEIYGLIATESLKIGVDPQFTHIIADIESSFNQFFVSEKGAVGVMQLMPETATELGVVNSYDAAQNIRGGVSYLKQLLSEFGNPLMAAAAYHSGPQSVRDANGIPQGSRTAKYMVRILNDYYGIANSNFNPSSADSVETVQSTKDRPAPLAANSGENNKPLQEGNPEHWDAGFVLHLE